MSFFFTSDSHFSHARVLDYSHRPFPSPEEMNAELVRRWNDVVTDRDTIYHLGDFALSSTPMAMMLFRQLRGQKHWIFGNHDKKLRENKEFVAMWASTADLRTIKVPDPTAPFGNQLIVLCHFALKVWDRSHYGSWSLFGHSHGSMPDDPHSLSLDVGVDCWNYTPVSYEALKDRMSKKQWRPVDGHGREESTQVEFRELNTGACVENDGGHRPTPEQTGGHHVDCACGKCP